MKKNIGLWIDYREAIIVELSEIGEKITRINSDAEKQIRFAGGSRKDGLQTTESIREKNMTQILVHISIKFSPLFVTQN